MKLQTGLTCLRARKAISRPGRAIGGGTPPACTAGQACVAAVLSVLSEPVSTWQILAHELKPSGSKHLPLRQCGGAAILECGAVDEMAFLGKVVVERSVKRGELLQ